MFKVQTSGGRLLDTGTTRRLLLFNTRRAVFKTFWRVGWGGGPHGYIKKMVVWSGLSDNWLTVVCYPTGFYPVIIFSNILKSKLLFF
jgi:hypothetical protein